MDQILVDWDMRSDRNYLNFSEQQAAILVDWDMRSDRNNGVCIDPWWWILVDWDMRSDRNLRSVRLVLL